MQKKQINLYIMKEVTKLYISLKIDHLTGNIRPPSRSGKTILTSVKAAY